MINTGYHFKLDIFEGPLDLLLHLVKQDELDLHQISLTKITSQYFEYLETLELLNITLASEFTVMAAHLLFLKSKSLLPQKQFVEDTSQAHTDSPQWELIHQLLEYKKFKNAAEQLAVKQAQQAAFQPNSPIASTNTAEKKEDDYQLKSKDLLDAFHKCLARFKEKTPPLPISKELYTVSDKIKWLISILTAEQNTSCETLFSSATSQEELITIFLALLELLKTKQIVSTLSKDSLNFTVRLTETVV